MMSIQSEYSKLLQSNDELRKKAVETETWNKERLNYELAEVSSGVLAYAYQKTANNQEPKHWLCTNCYENKKKSILQLGNRGRIDECLSCPNCAMTIRA